MRFSNKASLLTAIGFSLLYSVLAAESIPTTGKFFYVDFWRLGDGLHEVELNHIYYDVDYWAMLCTETPYTALFSKDCESCQGSKHKYDMANAKKEGHLSGVFSILMFDWILGLKKVTFTGGFVNSDHFAMSYESDDDHWLTINSSSTLAVNYMSPSFEQSWDGVLGIGPVAGLDPAHRN